MFNLSPDKKPKGDQPKAIEQLVNNLKKNSHEQVLLGATGTGKTFTIANVINQVNRQTIIMAPNKILASQLYGEFKELFPNNAVEYYISNFDYYQPEAYKPQADLYIEKVSQTNDEIEKLRLHCIDSLASRNDVIVIASVAAIYGTYAQESYKKMIFTIGTKMKLGRLDFAYKLVASGYKASQELSIGKFRSRGEIVDIMEVFNEEVFYRIIFFGDEIDEIMEIDIENGKTLKHLSKLTIKPAATYVYPENALTNIIDQIRSELSSQLSFFKKQNNLVAYERLKNRVNRDLEDMKEFGICKGIENYSMYLDNRTFGDTPLTLFDHLNENFLLILDESHLSIPQLSGMYYGDRNRKQVLVDYGFRLPSALENRPLKPEEFFKKISNAIYVSATPGKYEYLHHLPIIEQINRPTGLVDPTCELVRKDGQFANGLKRIKTTIKNNGRCFVLTLTKRMAEQISNKLGESGVKSCYLHDELNAFERQEAIVKLRKGTYDVIVGINLLREGLDLPELELILIYDADQTGFMRNYNSLIQIIGRAARNINGHIVMYCNQITQAIKDAIKETNRRRQIQIEYNKEHKIIPTTIVKPIPDIFNEQSSIHKMIKKAKSKDKLLKNLKKEIMHNAKKLNFKEAARLRDFMLELQNKK